MRSRRSADLRRHLLGPRWRGGRWTAGAQAVNDISGGSEEMFELVAERGCGYVLMHIEGPPRVDRPWREYGDVVDHLRAWFEGRVELARELGVARGADRDRPRTRLRPQPRPGPGDPAAARRAAGAGPAALRLALAQGLHRRRAGRLLGGALAGRRARVGDGRRGGPGGPRGRRRPPHPRPQLACRRCGSPAQICAVSEAASLGAALGRSRSTRRGATGGSSPRAPRRSGGRGRSRCRARSTPAFAEALRRAGIESLYTHQLAGLRDGGRTRTW